MSESMESKETITKNEWMDFFDRTEWVFFLVFIALGTALRWVHLEDRPFHHDESLYAVFANYVFTDPENKFYQYQPILHGPFLFNFLPLFYGLFGVSSWSARMPITLVGSFLLLMPFFFRKFLQKRFVLALTAAIALSPCLIYYSRFVGHDLFVLLSLLIILYGACMAKAPFRSFFIIGGLSLHFCIKENAFVFIAQMIGLLVFEFFFKRMILKEADTTLKRIFLHIKHYPIMTMTAGLVGAMIYCYQYSAGFRYSEGILNGLYRESLSYWLNQHQMERIKGPFLFQFFFLSWYEFTFMVIFMIYLMHFYSSLQTRERWISAVPLTVSIGLYFVMKSNPFENGAMNTISLWYSKLFKLKIPLDALAPLNLIYHSVMVTIVHLRSRKIGLAFIGYFFFSSFFTYSYLGEKVPWLALYILVPGMIYLTLYFQEVFKEFSCTYWERTLVQKILWRGGWILLFLCLIILLQGRNWMQEIEFVSILFILWGLLYIYFQSEISKSIPFWQFFIILFSLYNLRISLMTNFGRAGAETEFISQVHTSKVFHELCMKIRDNILVPVQGQRKRILVLDDSIWPATWYFRNMPEYSFSFLPTKTGYFDYVIKRQGIESELEKTHSLVAIPLRSWWVPDYGQMRLKDFLAYSFTHVPWNASGHLYVTFGSRK